MSTFISNNNVSVSGLLSRPLWEINITGNTTFALNCIALQH